MRTQLINEMYEFKFYTYNRADLINESKEDSSDLEPKWLV